MNGNVSRLCQRRDQRTAAESAYYNCLREEFPIGGVISWQRLGHIYSGIAVRHSGTDRIKVRNEQRDSEYWINACDIVDFHPRLAP